MTRLGQKEMRPRRGTPLRVRFSEGLEHCTNEGTLTLAGKARAFDLSLSVGSAVNLSCIRISG